MYRAHVGISLFALEIDLKMVSLGFRKLYASKFLTGLENAGLGQSAADPECCAKRIFKRFRVACTDFFLVPAKKEMPEAVSVPRATLLLPMPDAQKKNNKE